MAITLYSPDDITPAYNPFYFRANSTNVAQDNFRFIVQIFTGNTTIGVTPIDTLKLNTRPTGYNLIFSPARVLESYIQFDSDIQLITGLTPSTHAVQYSLDFGEEYGSLSTGTTAYTGLAQSYGYVFAAVAQYNELPSFSYHDYLMSSATGKFLTKQPRTGVYIKNTTDMGTLTWMNPLTASRPNIFAVKTYQNSGGTTINQFRITGTTAAANKIEHIPAGIWNLNNAGNKIVNTGDTTIDISRDYKYEISLIYDNGSSQAAKSETITYLIDGRCSKYSTVRLMWLNRLGGWDYYNFNFMSRKTINVTRNSFKKELDWNYGVGDRGTTILDIDGNWTYTIASDFISDAEATWLEEIITSPEVFVIDSTGVATPIIIDTNSYETKKSLNDKLFNMELSYTLANKLNAQRN